LAFFGETFLATKVLKGEHALKLFSLSLKKLFLGNDGIRFVINAKEAYRACFKRVGILPRLPLCSNGSIL
jgi:hypothetical protein